MKILLQDDTTIEVADASGSLWVTAGKFAVMIHVYDREDGEQDVRVAVFVDGQEANASLFEQYLIAEDAEA